MSWPMVKLGQLVSVKGGKRLPLGAGYSDVKTSFPYIRVTDFEKHSVNISNVLHLSADVQQKIARYTISSEDVYISIAGSIGIVGIVPEELDGANLTENAAKLVIIDKSKLDKRYLMRFLATAGQPQLHEQAKTTSQPKLALFRIEEVEIPLPPLAEQKRIAAILDKADAIRRKRQQAIQLADDFLRAVFLEMFGDPVTNPKGWEVKPLGSFCTLQGGYAFKSDEFSDDGIPLLKITNVHFEDAIWDDISYLPKEKLTDKSNFALECGDLVMAMTRPVIQSLNSVKIIEIKEADIPSLLNQRVGRFKGYTNVLNKNYLKYFLYSDYFKAEVEKLCSVALQPNVSSKQIESIQCCIPDLHAQENFSRTVEIVSRMLSKLHSFSKNNMLEALSQKAFSGQL